MSARAEASHDVARERKLPREFYLRENVVNVSRDLLGKVLCSRIRGVTAKAIITETEAYAGTGDRASHAFGGRHTKRTAPMYLEGGRAYVYLCYGLHHLFNVVTGPEEVPHAVLVRAAKPLVNTRTMLRRRRKQREDARLLGGPGSLAQALGITTRLTGRDLLGDTVWLEDWGIAVDDEAVEIGPRIGVHYAGDDALRPYRFVLSSLPAAA